MTTEGLEKYYPGDAAWQNFAALFDDDWAACNFRADLLKALGGEEEIAKVVYGSVFRRALRWIDEPVPALLNQTPRACAGTEAGRKRLKTMLMRMPR